MNGMMGNELSPVSVIQLPQDTKLLGERFLLRELYRRMDAIRPRIVLDCSRLPELDESIVYLLLCCLEEAMKRNGDLKLAAIPNYASVMFARSGLDRLFEVFDTVSGAVNSFHLHPLDPMPQTDGTPGLQNLTPS